MENRILLVEDNEVVSRCVAQLLRLRDYDVVVASNGSAAWRLLRDPEPEFDLIISDYQMPKMDGIELLRRVRGHEHTKRIPFLLTSAGGSLKDGTAFETACSSLNAHFLPKPCSAYLADVVEGMLT